MLELLQAPPTTTISVGVNESGGLLVLQDGRPTEGGNLEVQRKQIVIWQCQVPGLTHLVLVIKGPAKAAPGESLSAKPPTPLAQEAYWWPAANGVVNQGVQVKNHGLSTGDEWAYGLVLCLGGSQAIWLDPRIIIRPS